MGPYRNVSDYCALSESPLGGALGSGSDSRTIAKGRSAWEEDLSALIVRTRASESAGQARVHGGDSSSPTSRHMLLDGTAWLERVAL